MKTTNLKEFIQAARQGSASLTLELDDETINVHYTKKHDQLIINTNPFHHRTEVIHITSVLLNTEDQDQLLVNSKPFSLSYQHSLEVLLKALITQTSNQSLIGAIITICNKKHQMMAFLAECIDLCHNATSLQGGLIVGLLMCNQPYTETGFLMRECVMECVMDMKTLHTRDVLGAYTRLASSGKELPNKMKMLLMRHKHS